MVEVSVAAVHGYREHRAGRRISRAMATCAAGTGAALVAADKSGAVTIAALRPAAECSSPQDLFMALLLMAEVCAWGDRGFRPATSALPRRAWSLATGQATWLSPRPELTEGRQLRDSAGFAPDFADQ